MRKLKAIPIKIKKIVFGYIRKTEKSFLLKFDIPNEVINLCLLFYGGADKWDIKWISDRMQLKDNSIIYGPKSDGPASSFCERIVENGYNEWVFKIEHCDPMYCGMTIGIWRVQKNKTPPMNTFFNKGWNQGHGLALWDGSLCDPSGGYSGWEKNYAPKGKSGDVIQFIFKI